MIKQILKIGGWTIFTIGVLVLLVFVNAGYDNISTTKPEIEIVKPGNHNFVTEEKVITLMNDLGYHFNGQKLGEIEIKRIEEKVSEIPGVKKVEAYKYNNGKVKIDIEQQLPIARIFLADGKMGFYMDEDGEIIPLSNDYVAKVPVFTGSIYEPFNEIPSVKEITVSDSISDLHILDEVYELASLIAKDESDINFSRVSYESSNRDAMDVGSNGVITVRRLDSDQSSVITMTLEFENSMFIYTTTYQALTRAAYNRTIILNALNTKQ
jgi:hypothetical protein